MSAIPVVALVAELGMDWFIAQLSIRIDLAKRLHGPCQPSGSAPALDLCGLLRVFADARLSGHAAGQVSGRSRTPADRG